VSLRLTRRPLSVPAAMEALEGPGLGGVVLFAGRVRPDATRRGRVVALEYEAHRTLARVVLAELERKVHRRYGAERVVLWHRLGSVPVGQVSVVVGVATVHRTEAFAAARFLIDQLKARAPIWKTERVQPARRRQSRPPSPGGRGAG
jgi:molybdopterin synthase catalytic subunit